jgi:hypothetical protein
MTTQARKRKTNRRRPANRKPASTGTPSKVGIGKKARANPQAAANAVADRVVDVDGIAMVVAAEKDAEDRESPAIEGRVEEIAIGPRGAMKADGPPDPNGPTVASVPIEVNEPSVPATASPRGPKDAVDLSDPARKNDPSGGLGTNARGAKLPVPSNPRPEPAKETNSEPACGAVPRQRPNPSAIVPQRVKRRATISVRADVVVAAGLNRAIVKCRRMTA